MSYVKDYISTSNLEEEISYHTEEARYHFEAIDFLHEWIDEHCKKYREHSDTLKRLKKSVNCEGANA